jgi:hypothetical protein
MLDLLSALGPGPNSAPPLQPSFPVGNPGAAPDLLELPQDQLDSLARDLQNVLDTYADVMKNRTDRWDEIEDAYAMKPAKRSTGDYPGAAELCSEMMMATVDQTNARVADQILSVKPLMRVEALDSFVYRQPDLKSSIEEFAKSAERFLDSYTRRCLKIEWAFPQISHRIVKLGTCVLRCSWEETIKPIVRQVPSMAGALKNKVFGKRVGRVRWTMISNSDTMIWPAWSKDWQDDYEWVGHRNNFTTVQLKSWAATVGLSAKDLEDLLGMPEGPGESPSLKPATAQGIDVQRADSNKDTAIHRVWELWGRQQIGDVPFPTSFYCFYSDKLRRILQIRLNPHRNGKHPYFPLRYKLIDQSAWGNGVGHELLMIHNADTAFRNIEIDSLMSAAFSVVVVRAGSLADASTDRFYPGMRIVTDDIDKDFEVKSFAEDGPIAMVYQAMGQNENRKMAATGIPAVLSGMGDPVMKSGAGTGSTIALIEQAGKKIGAIDKTIRRDLTPLYSHTLDLIAQFAPPSVFLHYAAPEDAEKLAALKQLRPGESVEEMFQLSVEAPSASNNREMQKQNAMAIWALLQQQAQTIMGLAQQVFPQMNPGGYVPYLVQWANLFSKVAQDNIDLNDLPGMREILPKIPLQPSPEQQVINQLLQQLQQMQQQAEALQQQLADLGVGAEPSGGGGEGEGAATAPTPPLSAGGSA